LEISPSHSRLKLALAIMTSPSAAFEEITQRKLLGTAFLIVALTGFVSMIGAIARAMAMGPVQWLALGKDNPLTWVGLYMLYAFALQKLLKWLGTETDYMTILLILGWSHVVLLIHQVAGAVWSISALYEVQNSTMMQILDALRLALPIWYLIIVGTGVQATCRIPLSRGIMSYFVVATAAIIAFDFAYGRARLAPFIVALPGLASMAFRLTPMYPDPWLSAPDQLPRLGAAVLGLILGIWNLAKPLGWDVAKKTRMLTAACIIGISTFGIYTLIIYETDYYGKMAHAQQLYDLDKFPEAAKKLEALLPILNDNAALLLDIADTHYLAGNNSRSIEFYNKYIALARKAKHDKHDNKALAHPYSGLGAVYDIQGKRDLAIKKFEAAQKAWPEFRDPWVRMAVTYDRMGNYIKAIESGEHATKKLGSEAPIAYIALAQAYAQTGDQKQAKAAMDKAKDLDEDLAKKIGNSIVYWKIAVNILTTRDLKYPLEKNPVPPAPKPVRKVKPRAKS